jgi:succinate-acetate transporter protein
MTYFRIDSVGNTLGATIFCCYGLFWWGFSFILIPFFGITGSYNGVANAYSPEGAFASEFESAVGLFLWVWFGITTLFLFSAARSSVVLIVLLLLLDFTFAFLGAFYYYGNPHFETVGGAFGIGTALAAYYLAMGSLFNREVCYFSVPLFSLAIED